MVNNVLPSLCLIFSFRVQTHQADVKRLIQTKGRLMHHLRPLAASTRVRSVLLWRKCLVETLCFFVQKWRPGKDKSTNIREFARRTHALKTPFSQQIFKWKCTTSRSFFPVWIRPRAAQTEIQLISTFLWGWRISCEKERLCNCSSWKTLLCV